eukprot:8302561-Lingulodinium_polyedra.AAC.1
MEWLSARSPCCRLAHSVTRERNELDTILGCILRPPDRYHYTCVRRVLGRLGSWETVDSLGPHVELASEEDALAPAAGK